MDWSIEKGDFQLEVGLYRNGWKFGVDIGQMDMGKRMKLWGFYLSVFWTFYISLEWFPFSETE